ncbi:MAG: pyruvate/2-oxoglutarate dehydrogenase complex dihydrolipoamide acyltransferase (E2) component, partial [Bradymonadia bacterium]
MPKMSTRRKLAIATWSSPREGNIYGKLTVDATKALAYITALRDISGERITITHFVGKAVAMALAKAPGLNGYLRFGAYHQHAQVSLAFLVALEDGADLAKAKVDNLDQKSLLELAVELKVLADTLR